jgi:hypothetical protein
MRLRLSGDSPADYRFIVDDNHLDQTTVSDRATL